MPTTNAYAVSRDVWDAIVPQATATDARERRATRWVIVAAVALVIATWFATAAGLFGPRLTSSSSSGSTADSATRTGQVTIDVRNTGRLGARITGVRLLTAAGSSLHVTGIRSTPESVSGGATGSLVIAYEITDCDPVRSAYGEDAGAGSGDLRAKDGIEVRATTWWGGTRTVPLEPLGSAVGDLIAPACMSADASNG